MRRRAPAPARLAGVEQRSPSAQLLVYRFGPTAEYAGRLVDALEQIEIGGSLRILDALFVARDVETGKLAALTVRGDEMGSLAAPLIGFRLDSSERDRATEGALAGSSGPAIQRLADRLAPGEAVAAILVDHVWARTLERGVSVTGGTLAVSAMVPQGDLAQLSADRLR
jgi:hypothetical protein